MGIFNDVICEYPLPDNRVSGETCQTKQFSPSLSKIRISKEGKLFFNNLEVPFHGWLYFYDAAGNDLCEYFAKFTDGELVTIETIAPLPMDFFETR